MADNTRTSWDAFLFEVQGKAIEVFPSEAPFLAQLSGVGDAERVGRFTRDMDGGRGIFSGRRVRHTLIPMHLQGGGPVTETGTWNRPHALSSNEVQIKLVDYVYPFSVTVDVERDSLDAANAQAVATLVKQARIGLARLENLSFLGDGTGLQVDITDGATSLTTTCGTTANFDVLLPGTVWDIRTRATGADPGQGNRRKIASLVESTRVITWDTALQASDGGSGNIVHTAADGIYIPNGWTDSATAGTVISQGLEQAAAATGTFEGINKATLPAWQGTDGRAGDTAVVPLSDQMLGAGVRRGRRAGLGVWDYGLGDPAAIDLYKDGKIAQVRYEPQYGKIKSGFPGIVYDGADRPFPLIKEPAMKKGALRLIDDASFQLYGDKAGPEFLADDGGMFRRFTPSNAKEADLLDRVQFGVTKCNTIVKYDNLAVA